LGEEGLRRVRKKKGDAKVGRGEVMKSERARHDKAETGINRCRHIIIGKRRKEKEGRHSLKEPRGSRRKSIE
jgi:hypothetical protein